MLAVVEHEQELALAEITDDRVGRRSIRVVEKSQRANHRDRHEVGIVIGARSTYLTSSPDSLAAWIASRVLPVPPAPVRVTKRLSAMIPRTSTICSHDR